MEQPSSEELKKIIDTCWEAVNTSTIGPIVFVKQGIPMEQWLWNAHAIQTFHTLVHCLCPKVGFEPPEENWKKGG